MTSAIEPRSAASDNALETSRGAQCGSREFKALLVRPKCAWPTLALFAGICVCACAASSAALLGVFHWGGAVLVNACCSYVAYSIVHEAAHGLVCSKRGVNDWIGRISLAFITVTPFFYTYRFLHTTHHLHVNDPHRDPDYYCGGGRWWTLPLRWASIDLAYVRFYLRPEEFSSRPPNEKREFFGAVYFAVALFALVSVMGWWSEFLWLYVLPTRIGIFVLAVMFDYLPHYPHDYKAADDAFLASNNRVGFEWLLSPLLVGQNYHLTHHLYPSAPFYRYRAVWEARRSFHEDRPHGCVQFYRVTPDRLLTSETLLSQR